MKGQQLYEAAGFTPEEAQKWAAVNIPVAVAEKLMADGPKFQAIIADLGFQEQYAEMQAAIKSYREDLEEVEKYKDLYNEVKAYDHGMREGQDDYSMLWQLLDDVNKELNELSVRGDNPLREQASGLYNTIQKVRDAALSEMKEKCVFALGEAITKGVFDRLPQSYRAEIPWKDIKSWDEYQTFVSTEETVSDDSENKESEK
jgi:hypothetical protein